MAAVKVTVVVDPAKDIFIGLLWRAENSNETRIWGWKQKSDDFEEVDRGYDYFMAGDRLRIGFLLCFTCIVLVHGLVLKRSATMFRSLL